MPVYDLESLVTALALVPFAYAATNIDNLLIMASLSAGRTSRANLVAGFVVASGAILLVASMAAFIDRLLPPDMLGYRMAPWMMILVGLYILSDRATDVV